MFKNLYIISTKGIIYYTKNFIEETFDDNLLVGFFTSTVNFSREALNSIVKQVDLGSGNKLVLELKSDEEIFAAAIVSSKDHNDLVRNILKNILQDFTDKFYPDYDITQIEHGDMDSIIKNNLKGKTTYSLYKRFLLSWLILGPLAIILTYFNIILTEYFIVARYLEQDFYTTQEILTRVGPNVVLISLAELIFVFAISNFISGFITLNLKIGFINSVIYFIIIVVAYFLSVTPYLIFIILAFTPLIIIISFGATYFGHVFALRRKIVKE
ncbi:MAG: hypothetical protein P8Y70_18575 [Candidatus Lokiarchaeota archaeon]